MAIPLLLDEQIHPAVAHLLRERGVDTLALREWHGGQYVSRPDDEILRAAHVEGRVLVTYDLRTIPALLRHLAESGVGHSGVIYVSSKTVRQGDIAGLANALERFMAGYPGESLTDQALFLPR